MQPIDVFDGALLVDKPAGPTSHDVVEEVRRHFRIPKVGHCGTLDPNATGLLVLLLGRATKLSERLMSQDKTYEGALKLGETTESHDAAGELVASLPVPPLTMEELTEAASSFVGDHLQTPPMVSAVKQGGVPLYKLARKGLEVERKARLVHIYTFEFDSYQEPVAHFRVACTKGTYVRTLVHDLGQKIGCGAHLSTLRRTRSGDFDVKDAIEFEAVLKLSRKDLEKLLIPFFKLAA
jgi:tRNA pseudouridine55 synthase